MAWKLRQEVVQDGQVCEPSEFRVNINEYVGELNGMLDMDNIAQGAITTNKVVRGAFTEVYSSNISPEVVYYFDTYSMGNGWMRKARTRDNCETLGDRTSSGVAASPGYSYETVIAVKSKKSTEEDLSAFFNDVASPIQMPHCRFEAKSDGLVKVEFSGFVQWMSVREFSNYTEAKEYRPEDKGLPQDRHDYPYFAAVDRQMSQARAVIMCSQWRLTVDGQSIAESGFLGSEFKAHPLYLCGAIPVQKSKEVNVQLEARFFWYGPITNEIKSVPGFKPELTRDCALACPTLITTFRKR